MNLRLSADTIRLRVSRQEARVLEEASELQESLSIPGRPILLSVQLRDNVEGDASFFATDTAMQALLKRSELLRLLDESASPRDCISREIDPQSKLQFIFEIDLHS